MNRRHASALSLVLLAAAMPASAQIYVGASAGRSDISVDRQARTDEFLDLGFTGAATTGDDSDTAWRVFAGYQFAPYFAVEAAYVDLGSFRFRTVVDPPGMLDGETSIKGEELSAVGRYPIDDRFAVYARAGVYFARTRAAYSAQGSVELVDGADRQRKRTTRPTYAIGASWAVTPQIGLRAEWARYTDLGDYLTGGKTDADLVSLGVAYSF